MGSFSPPQDEVKSSDSVPTSEEYEILKDHSPIPETGGLVVPGEEDLEFSLSTVLPNESLGAVTVHNPKDEAAIQEHMAVMNQAISAPLAVTVSVSRSSNDSVVFREAATRTRVAI